MQTVVIQDTQQGGMIVRHEPSGVLRRIIVNVRDPRPGSCGGACISRDGDIIIPVRLIEEPGLSYLGGFDLVIEGRKELIPEDPVLGFVRAVTHIQKETVVIGQFIEHRICVPDPVVQQKSIGVQGMRDGSFRIFK
jgi:hypothetical protein